MYSPSHRPAMSASSLQTSPGIKQQRRMTTPVPPPAPLDLPEPAPNFASSHPNSSGSPLRNGVTLVSATRTPSEDGSPTSEDYDPWGTREQMNRSPSPSITKFASSFAQRVGSLVSSVSPGSQPGHLPTEAELEADAESQRERSRREAERILTQEAAERKKVEERVLEMLEASRTRPTRSQTTPSPSAIADPTASNKEGGGWWAAAKNRLTPTKELTPAQQIVQETKTREKETRKNKEKEWPSNGKGKYQDPAYQQLSLPPGARPPGGAVGGGAIAVPASPGSPSPHSNQPSRQLTGSPTTMTPSPSSSATHPPINPHHHNNSTNRSPAAPHPMPQLPTASPVPSTSSSREPLPLYAQFSNQGTLDVAASLVTIARRFEKLERWAVGHVRALEERMSDVEKWLVDKEREREQEAGASKLSSGASKPALPAKDGEREASHAQQVVREVTIERKTVEIDQEVKRDVGEMKEELGELRGRVGELGREMARLASSVSDTPSASHSYTPSEASGFGIGRIASPGTGPSTPAAPSPRTLPSIPTQHAGGHVQSPSTQSIAQSETASIVSSGTSTRTKLPYPTGDYTSPSPPSSPRPSSVAQSVGNYTANNAASNISRTRPLSYSGLPIPQTNFTSSVGLPRSSGISDSPSGSPSLPPPSGTRPLSTSPNPRKRYTVALGQPISSSPSASSSTALKDASDPPILGLDEKESDFGQPLFAEPQTAELQTAFFTHVPSETDTEEEDKDMQEEGERGAVDLHRQETIGKTPITLSRLSLSPPPSQNSSPNNRPNLPKNPPRTSPSNPRIRAQSTYGVPGSSASSVASLSRHEGPHDVMSPSQSEGIVEDRKGSWRTRSRSIDRVGLGVEARQGGSSFVDPLVVRKKEKDTTSTRSPVISSPGGPRGRVPFGDLLAFFDAEKENAARR